jgi:hypothetical protein
MTRFRVAEDDKLLRGETVLRVGYLVLMAMPTGAATPETR